MTIDLNLIRLIERNTFEDETYSSAIEDTIISQIIDGFEELSDQYKVRASFSISYRYSMYYESSRSYEIEDFIDKITDNILMCSVSLSGICSKYDAQKKYLRKFLVRYIEKYAFLIRKEENNEASLNAFFHCMKVCDDNDLHDTAKKIYKLNCYSMNSDIDKLTKSAIFANHKFSDSYIKEFFTDFSS